MGSTGVTMADLPNILIMIASLVALFIMLVILLRNMEFIGIVGEGNQSEWRRATLQPPRLLMQRVHIPFTFKLNEDKPVSYKGVHCSISSTVGYWYSSWWGAPVAELHRTLWAPLTDILASRGFIRCTPHDERGVIFSSESTLKLGAPPRSCYPLVVIIARDDSHTADLRPDDTVALISVIHIKDDQCPLPSGIIAQYLKQANGHLSSLKQLYVTGECAETEGYQGTDGLCCVCATRPLSRAILPCRHACLCSECLPKLDKCPMCRSAIDSYFCIRNEDEQLDMKQQNFPFNRRLFNLFHYH